VTSEPYLAKGSVLAGKYEVERVLGRGGMGVVVAARHLELDDRVAVKFLLPEMVAHPEIVARFLGEARAARKLRTEHAAKVSDVGTLPETGAPFMVMELLEGCDLASLLAREGPLPAHLAVEYLLQASVGVAEAHSHGIIHRDLKPANLFLTKRPDGTPCVKVLDFGIAKIGGGASIPSLTQTTGMLGTALYAAPEQLQSAKLVDNRCDVWSLGVTLYELVTGHFPFQGDDLGMLIGQILTMPHTPIQSWAPGLPDAFVRAVDRALAKQRDARFSTVADLADALAPFGGGESARSVQAIHRILGVPGGTARSGPVSPTAPDLGPGPTMAMPPPTEPARSAPAVTVASSPRPARRAAGIVLGALALLVVGALGGRVLLGRRARHPAPTETELQSRAAGSGEPSAPSVEEAQPDRPPPAPPPMTTTTPPKHTSSPKSPPAPSSPPGPSPSHAPSHVPPPVLPETQEQKVIAMCKGKLSPIDAKTEKILRILEQSENPDDRREAQAARQRAKEELKAMCDQLRTQGML
jgi:serine/threonine protein kinase